MRYLAEVFREGSATIATFPDCPDCNTFTRPGDRRTIEDNAREALLGWLESTLAAGDEIPWPSDRLRAPKGGSLLPVYVPPKLAVKLRVRQARQRAKLSQAQLAKRAGVSQQQIAKIENPDTNLTIDTLEKVAAALGWRLEIDLVQAG